MINHSSQGAVYKGVAILNSSLTQPALAVTDFHGGLSRLSFRDSIRLRFRAHLRIRICPRVMRRSGYK